MAGSDRFDGVLLGLAQQHGGIEELLHTFFGFLHRRTDFFVVQTPDVRHMGFPEGVAEKIVMKQFRSFPLKRMGGAAPSASRSGAREAAARPARPTGTGKAVGAPAQAASAAPPAQPPIAARAPAVAASAASATAAAASAATSNAAASIPAAVSAASTAPATSAAAIEAASDTATSAADDGVPTVALSKDGKQIPVGNGGVCDRYWWTQTLYEVTVNVPVPKGTKARDVKWSLHRQHVRLGLADAPPLLEGKLGGDVNEADCLWTVEGGERVSITLDKRTHTWWRSVLEGDPEIDTTQVDSTMKLEEYDEETQAAIRKIMFDQRQKAMGLPSSDEIQMESVLERAKLLPGSPFLPPAPGADAADASAEASGADVSPGARK